MSRYTGKRGMDAKQLCIVVLAFLFAVIALTISATAVYCDIPVSDQIRDMLLVPLH